MLINIPAVPDQPPLTADHNVACQWFAMCDHAATGAVRHPILGAVLACQRCADRAESPLESASVEDEAE